MGPLHALAPVQEWIEVEDVLYQLPALPNRVALPPSPPPRDGGGGAAVSPSPSAACLPLDLLGEKSSSCRSLRPLQTGDAAGSEGDRDVMGLSTSVD